MKELFSGYFSLNKRDFINGLVMAVLGAVGGIVVPILDNWINSDNWAMPFNWHTIVKASAGAAVIYIWKNLFSNKEGKFLGKKKTEKVVFVAPKDIEQQNSKS